MLMKEHLEAELIVTSAEVIGAVNPETPFPITESTMNRADGTPLSETNSF